MKKTNFNLWDLKNSITLRFIFIVILLILFSGYIKAQCNNNWAGSSPTITFQLNDTTISNFSITLTDVPCFSSITFTFSTITLSNDSFTFNINSFPTTGTISGILSEDGNSINGTYNINLKYLHPVYFYPVSCGIVSESWDANAETPRPAANAGGDTTVCAGQGVTLTATGGESYSWSGGITNGVAFIPAETGTYTVTVTAANGCTDTDSATVTVNPLPAAGAGDDTTVCAGQSVTLTATGGESCSWSPGITNGVEFMPAETGTYTVTVTDINGCTDTDDVTVTVNPLPAANAGNNKMICAGQSVILTATGGVSYSWSGGITNGVPFIPAVTGTYTVMVTASNGCTDMDSAIVVVNPIPAANAGNDTAVCAGQNVTLTATGGENYSWSGGITNGIEFTPAATMTYTVTVTASNGCTDTDDATVTVNPLPSASAGDDTTVCAGQSITLTATGGVSYSWSGGITNGIAFIPEETGTYTVTVTDANGCTDTDEITVNVNNCTYINTTEKSTSEINIYPNPAHEEFTISIEKIKSEFSVYITSIIGNVIFSKDYINFSGTFNEKIKLNDHFMGIYFVIINDGQMIKTKKIIVE